METKLINRKKPSNFWKDAANVRDYFNELKIFFGITENNDWYKVSWKQLKQLGGRKLFDIYDGMPFKALAEIYPDVQWKYHRFKDLPIGYWLDVKNQRNLFEDIGKQLGIKEFKDWYKISPSSIEDSDFDNVFANRYSRNLYRALQTIYPEYEWRPWLFQNSKLSPEIFNIKENRRKFLEDIGNNLGFKQIRSFYSLNVPQVTNANGGVSFLQFYSKYQQEALWLAINECFPEYKWNEFLWKIIHNSDDFWKSKENQIRYLDLVGKEMGVEKWQDWYNIRKGDVIELGGRKLIQMHNNTLSDTLAAVYSEKPWKMSDFYRVPTGFWNKSVAKQREFFDEIAKKLNINRWEDWLFITRREITQIAGAPSIQQPGGLLGLLKKLYPEHNWPNEKIWNWFSGNPSKSQLLLFKTLSEVLNEHEVLLNYPLSVEGVDTQMDLDVFVPSLKLAFEYQGEQHYYSHHLYGNLEQRKQVDAKKKEICNQVGIKLIEIPFWWDGRRESLTATLEQNGIQVSKKLETQSNDIVNLDEDIEAIPIAQEPPENVRKSHEKLEAARYLCIMNFRDFLNLLTAAPKRIRKWQLDHDPTNFLLSNIYYGVHIYYNGSGRIFLRIGYTLKEIITPKVYTLVWPSIPLEGYLVWNGLDHLTFQNFTDFVLNEKNSNSPLWDHVIFYVSDLPQMFHLPLKQRLEKLEEISTSFPENVVPIMREVCKGYSHLESLLETSRKNNKVSGILIQNSSDSIFSERGDFKLEKFPTIIVAINRYNHAQEAFECSSPLVSLSVPKDRKFLELKQGDIVECALKYDRWEFVRIRKDIEWPSYIKQQLIEKYGFYYTIGKASKCAGCRRNFEKNEPRVQTTLKWTYQVDSPPRIGTLSFCANVNCINKAIKEYSYSREKVKSVIPEFEGKIAINPLLEKPASIEGITWFTS